MPVISNCYRFNVIIKHRFSRLHTLSITTRGTFRDTVDQASCQKLFAVCVLSDIRHLMMSTWCGWMSQRQGPAVWVCFTVCNLSWLWLACRSVTELMNHWGWRSTATARQHTVMAFNEGVWCYNKAPLLYELLLSCILIWNSAGCSPK